MSLFDPFANSPQKVVSLRLLNFLESGGIVTDVCTTFLALSLRAAGYSVWANVEASGTTTPLIRDVSNDRMARAGVQVVSLFSIVGDLMRDWRNTPGVDTVLPWLAKYYPAYGILAQMHVGAVRIGEINPGEEVLVPEGFSFE